MKLTDWEIQILRNKLPKQKDKRWNILIRIDVAFQFNRTNAARFLASHNLTGYSRPHLYKLLGPPVLRAKEYEVMKTVFERIGREDLLPYIVARGVARNFFTGSLGSAPDW